MVTKNIMLNRAAFTQRVFDSSALSVLTSLFYRFTHEGNFDMIIQRNNSVILRCNVHVGGKTGKAQTTLDLANLNVPAEGLSVDTGSVICFFVSKGTERYSVSITEIGERQKITLLNSSETVPEGGIFSVTLTRPGTYSMRTVQSQERGKIHVRLPRDVKAMAAKGEKYRTEEAAVIEVDGKGNFKPNAVNIYSGQSVVFICHVPARIQVAFEADEQGDDDVDIKRPPIDRKPPIQRPRPKYKGKGGDDKPDPKGKKN